MKWKRPSNFPYPNVWHRFTATQTKSEGTKLDLNVQIEDVNEDRRDEVVEFFIRYYLPDEPMVKAVNLKDDPVSVDSFRKEINIYLSQNMSVMATLDSSNDCSGSDCETDQVDGRSKIIGVCIQRVVTEFDSAFPSLPGSAFEEDAEMSRELKRKHNAYKLLNCDKYISIQKICVHPEYSRMRICYQLMSNVERMARIFQVPASMGMFSSRGTQIVAKKLGFQIYSELLFDEYKKCGKIVFEMNGLVEAYHWMGKKYQL